MTNIFIIILNFNNQKDIILCLKSLIKAYPKINIIVVDNASTDNSLQSIISLSHEKLMIIKNKINLGFAKGVNKGIRFVLKQGAESVLLLNPDTLVGRGFLEPLLTNRADVVGPIIKFKRKGQWVYDFGGKINFWIGRTSHDEHLTSNVKNLKSPDYLSGCCLLVRRKVFEKIDLLDERYFLFFEDADFCLRAKKADFKVALEPKSMILHKLSEGKEKSLKSMYHLLRSNFIFINTWLPAYKRPIAYLYLCLLALKMLLNRL
ncbi:glycosyltransferase family 2 protein [Patescibacteria group bacterium]|nr:glycosyltransferase family 2 protein [Patescibacteria group bacterium]